MPKPEDDPYRDLAKQDALKIALGAIQFALRADARITGIPELQDTRLEGETLVVTTADGKGKIANWAFRLVAEIDDDGNIRGIESDRE